MKYFFNQIKNFLTKRKDPSKETVYFFGGSFDPWHNGHSKIVSHLMAEGGYKILIAPSYNPWKNEGLLTLEERIGLIKKLYQNNSKVEVLTEGFSYTVEFIEKYAKQYNLILVMGKDAFDTYPNWKDFSTIKKLISKEFVSSRSRESSTAVRANLRECYGLVPQNIYEYLLINKVHYKKPSLTSDAILLSQTGKILVMLRNTHPYKDTWVFPGGFVDEGENPKNTALRELAEETGIDIAPVKISFNEVFYKKNRDPRDWIVSMSYVIKINCEPEPTATKEALKFKWVTPEELLILDMGFDHAEAAQAAYRNNLLFG